MALRTKPPWGARERTVQIIGDVHFDEYPSRNGKLAADMGLARIPEPAYRIHPGDLTDNAAPAEDTSALAFLAAHPVDVLVPGNHDLRQAAGLRTVADFTAVYGFAGNATYDFDLGGHMRRVVAVSPLTDAAPRSLDETALTFLADELGASPYRCWVVCHYPPYDTVGELVGGEEQWRTDFDTIGSIALHPSPRIQAICQEAGNVELFLAGHSHSDKDAEGLIKTVELKAHTPESLAAGAYANQLVYTPGTIFPPATTRAYANLLSPSVANPETDTTGWDQEATDVTAAPLALSTAWANEGTKSLLSDGIATADGAALYQAINPRVAVTPGDRISAAAFINVVNKGANGQRMQFIFQDASDVSLPPVAPDVSSGDYAVGLGVVELSHACEAPPAAAWLTVRIGNSGVSSWTLANGEESKFHVDSAHISVPTEDPPTDSRRSDFESPLAPPGWVAFIEAGGTLHDFGPSTVWAAGGTRSLHYEADAPGDDSSAYVRMSARPVTPGVEYTWAGKVNVIQKGAKAPRPFVIFRDASAVAMPYNANAGLGQALGVSDFALRAMAPPGAADAILYFGNSGDGGHYLMTGETSEFYLDNVWEAADVDPPPGSKQMIALNASAIPYTGKSGAFSHSDRIATFELTLSEDGSELEVRARDHGSGNWTTIQGERVTTVAVPA